MLGKNRLHTVSSVSQKFINTARPNSRYLRRLVPNRLTGRPIDWAQRWLPVRSHTVRNCPPNWLWHRERYRFSAGITFNLWPSIENLTGRFTACGLHFMSRLLNLDCWAGHPECFFSYSLHLNNVIPKVVLYTLVIVPCLFLFHGIDRSVLHLCWSPWAHSTSMHVNTHTHTHWHTTEWLSEYVG